MSLIVYQKKWILYFTIAVLIQFVIGCGGSDQAPPPKPKQPLPVPPQPDWIVGPDGKKTK